MRRACAVFAALLLSISIGFASVGRADVASINPFWFWDDYLNGNWTNFTQTTAVVRTAAPGTVQLPPLPVVASLRPGNKDLILAGPDGVQGYGAAGASLQPWPWSLAGSAQGAAWLADGSAAFAVARDGAIRLYRIDAAGQVIEDPRGQAVIPGLRAVQAATATDLWAATDSDLQYLSWSGSQYLLNSALTISGVNKPVAWNFHPDSRRMIVAEPDRIRFFALDASSGSYREFPAFGVPGVTAQAVAWAGDGSGFWALTETGLDFWAVTTAGTVLVDAWRQVPPADVLGLAASPWGSKDVAVIVPSGIRYMAWAGVALVDDPALSVSGVSLLRYQPTAQYISVVFTVDHPVEKLRIETQEALPPGTATQYEVSTDGGATWTLLPLNTNTPVPPGNQVAYRITLTTADPTATPAVDRTDVLEIATVVQQLSSDQYEVVLIQ